MRALMAGMVQHGVFAEFNPLEPSQSVPVFTVPLRQWHLIVSNHALMVGLVAVFLLIVIPVAARRRRMVPSGIQNVVEAICVFLREDVARPVMHEHTDRYIGFVWTVFFFVLGLNLIGMIPSEKFVVLLTGKKNHYGGPATANIFITGALATVTFFMTHIYGIRQQGFGRYIINFAPAAPWWIMPLLYLLEVITAFVRPMTLAVRLFANIIAGHILVATFLGLILVFKNYAVAAASIFAVVAVSFLELLVAFIQAFIFTFLSALYIGFSVSPEH